MYKGNISTVLYDTGVGYETCRERESECAVNKVRGKYGGSNTVVRVRNKEMHTSAALDRN